MSGAGAKQLAQSIEEAIRRGDLPPGAPLPPVREMAAELGRSPTTIAAAVARLRTRGLVVTRERSRSFVSWRPPLASAWPRAELPPGVRDLATGNPDPQLLPDQAPVLRRLEPPQPLYGTEPVLPELVELVGAELEEAGIRRERLAVTSGALDGIERSLGAWLNPGDLVAVEDPGYPGVLDLCRTLGLGLRPVPVDERGMVPDELGAALREGAAAVVLTPRGQNPTGAALDTQRARELSTALAAAPDVLVLEDDHLGPVAGVARHTVVRRRSRWAVARSLTKSLGPDLRLAVLAGDHETIDRVEGRTLLGPQWVSQLLQRLAAELWRDRRVQRQIAGAAATYRKRREAFTRALARHGLSAQARSGLNVWLPVPDESPVVSGLLDRGWAVAAGTPYRLRTDAAIRVTIAALGPDEAETFAADLAHVLRPVRRTRAA